jgi:Tfp pilus assembly protein PilX
MPQAITVRRRRPDGGAVLITVLLVMIALLGLGVTALWLTSGTMQMGANSNQRAMALYVAEIGIERVRQDMNTRTWDATVETQVMGGAGTNPCSTAVLDSLPTTANPTGVGVIYRENNNANGKCLMNIPFPDVNDDPQLVPGLGIDRTGTNPLMGRYTIWIRNDGGEFRQYIQTPANNFNTIDNNDVFVVRAMGIAPDNKTTVVLEVTMGPGSIPAGGPPSLNPNSPVLCNSGKNACDDNSSVQAGVVVQ